MNNQNQNPVLPQGQIQTGMIAPEGGGSRKTRRTDIINLPIGGNPGIIFGMVDLGTQVVTYKNITNTRRQVYVAIEHPQLKQLFYVEDTERRSTMTSKKSSFSYAPSSFLKSCIDAVEKRELTQEEVKTYDSMKLLGQTVGVSVKHKQYEGVVYDNIGGVSAWNYPLPEGFVRSNDFWFFTIDKDQSGRTIGNNFLTENYAKLPGFLKKLISESKEAQEYAERGGQFAEMPKEDKNQPSHYPQQNQQFQQPQQFQQQAPQQQQNNFANQPMQQQQPQQNQGQGPQQQQIFQNNGQKGFVPQNSQQNVQQQGPTGNQGQQNTSNAYQQQTPQQQQQVPQQQAQQQQQGSNNYGFPQQSPQQQPQQPQQAQQPQQQAQGQMPQQQQFKAMPQEMTQNWNAQDDEDDVPF